MSGEEPATKIAPVESPQMVSTVKLLILKKGEYTLWSMRMEQYLTNTDYILGSDIEWLSPISSNNNENGVETEVPPKTAQALLARQRERKAKSIMLLAIPEEYQLSVEADIKVSSDQLKSQKVAFLTTEDTSSSNESQLDDEDIEHIDHDDVEEIDSNGMWPAFYEGPFFKGIDNALMSKIEFGYDWSYVAQDEPTKFAIMAYTSNSSGSCSKNCDTIQTNDMFKKIKGYHAVPPPLTGNYMPPLADLSFAGLDDSVYRPTTNKTSASVSQVEAISTTKQSSFRAATSTGAVKQVNTTTHTNRVNVSKLRTNAFHKSNSPIRRSFYKSTAPNTRISNEKVNIVRVNGVNTAGQTAVSAVKGNEVIVVKASATSIHQSLHQQKERGFKMDVWTESRCEWGRLSLDALNNLLAHPFDEIDGFESLRFDLRCLGVEGQDTLEKKFISRK
ncbi:hypothetical protein Tco_1019313 [Tanacetum coccineum]|uniref:Uncharacterized protein n=1 Tax=Tanacetum coccineum TaxID=301880 RepID=A0ABQ5FY19_9ASTR